MTYQETLSYLYGLGRFGIKPGLDRVGTLLKRLGNPQDRLAVVHVAGTNGKGSTASFLSSILSSAGHRTGLFTSPHLTEFTERISIDGSSVKEDQVVELAAEVIEAAMPESTFFEIVTAMAYLHFARSDVDIVVMEAGMGGRFDATNIANGIMSIIASISLDHCEYLGDNLAAIAEEKAGIIKHGRPVLVARQPQAAQEVLARVASLVDAPLYQEGTDFSCFWQGETLSYSGLQFSADSLRPGIGGRYQSTNAALALCAAELLRGAGFAVADGDFSQGVAAAHWPGRMEMLSYQGFRVLLDGAHNPAGAVALAESLQQLPRRKLIVVMGVMQDKDLDGILSPLVSQADMLIAVAPAIERALAPEKLAAVIAAGGNVAVAAGVVKAGLELAKDHVSSPDDLVVVCGSLFTVGEARAFLLDQQFQHFRG